MYRAVEGVKLYSSRPALRRLVDMIFLNSYTAQPQEFKKSHSQPFPPMLPALPRVTMDSLAAGWSPGRTARLRGDEGRGTGDSSRRDSESGRSPDATASDDGETNSFASDADLKDKVERTRARLSAADRGEWAMLYCGAAQAMRLELQAIAREWGVQFNEESFSW